MARNNRQPRRTNRPSSVKLLQRPENGLEAFADASVDAFLMFDESLNLVGINPAGERLLGVSREADMGKNIADIVPDIKRTGRYEKYLSVIETGRPFFADDIIPHPRFGDKHLSVKAFKVWRGVGMIVSDITERKQVEAVLEHSEKYFRALTENASDAVAVVSSEGVISYESPSFKHMLGYELEDRKGKNSFEFVHPDDLPKAVNLFAQLSQNPSDIVRTEIHVRHRDGSWRTLELVGRNLLNDPAVAGIVANFRDVTEQRKAEEELRRSEEYSRALVENALDVIMVLNGDGTIRYESPSIQNVTGYKAEEREGRSVFDLIHPDNMPKAASAFAQMLRDEIPSVDMEFRLRHKDGSWRVIRAIGNNLLSNPVVAGVVANFSDITEQRRMEEALRESELLATATIEGMSDGVMLVGMDGKVAYINKAFEKILGYKIEELIGTSATELPTYSGSRDRKKARQALKKIIEKGSAEPIDMVALTKDGVEIPINFTASVVKGAKGNPKTLVAVIRDVTEAKKAEEALRRSEEYFRALMENSLDAVTIMNEDGTIRYESPSYERLLGFKPEERVGGGLYERIHSDDVTRVGDLFAEFLQNRVGTLHTEVRAQHKDGSWRFIEAIGSNLLDNPVVKGIVINLRDITERKNAEEALRQSEQRYRLLADNVTDVIWTSDMNLRFTYFSPSIRHFRGYSVEEAMGLSLEETLSPASIETALKVFTERMAAENMGRSDLSGPVTLELEHKCKNGGTVWGEVKMDFLRDLEGKPVGILGVARDITERRNMEEELRRLSDAVKMTTESVAIADLRGRIVDINEAGLKMYGLENRADLVGKNPFDIIVTEDQPKALENMSKIMETGSVKGIEYYINRKDGKRALIETSVSLIRGEEGEPKGIVAVARDITERRRMEEELRESEERFRAIFDNSVDGILVTDLETKSLYTCNKAMCQMLGYNLEEIRNLKVTDIHPKKDLPYIMTEIERERQGASLGVKVLPLERKDGSVLYAEVTPSLVTFAGRQYLAGIFRDISERKRAEEALKSSEERYRLVVDNANEAIVVAQDGMLKFFNSRSIGILGYSKEEMASKLFIELIHPDDQQMVGGRYMARLRGEELPSVYSFRVVGKEGNIVWVEINAVVISWEGRPATLNFLTDITERKKAEEEKQRMEGQLLLAGRLAAVGELSAGVAHELNNPIAAIQGFAQLLTSRNDLDETMKNDLGIIYREAQRAAKITQNLLSFARRHEPEKNLISLNEVIEKTLELRAHQMKVNNIELVVDFAADLPKTMADFFQMQQVFVNIINNAEQAMVGAHGKGRLVVKTQKVGDMIQISFADDGPGIPEENMKRIFDPFFTTKEVGKGTGLGLSICYGLVEAHGGRIYARSKLGEGATFVVEIPIVAEGQ